MPVSQVFILLLLIFSISSFILKPFVNARFGHPASIDSVAAPKVVSDSKYHFVWKKIRKTDQYQSFLDKYCPQKKYYYLCDSQRMELLLKDGLMNDMHGSNVRFLGEIEDAGKTVLSDPSFLFRTFWPRMKYALTTLNNHRIRNPFQNQSLVNTVGKNLPHDTKYLVESKSYSRRLFTRKQLQDLEHRNKIVIISSALLLLAGLFLSPILSSARKTVYPVLFALPLAHLVNAGFMGIFANPNARYCSRTSWLVVLAALLLLFMIFDRKKVVKSNYYLNIV